MKIHVMGPGCAKCEEAEKTVREAVAEAGPVEQSAARTW